MIANQISKKSDSLYMSTLYLQSLLGAKLAKGKDEGLPNIFLENPFYFKKFIFYFTCGPPKFLKNTSYVVENLDFLIPPSPRNFEKLSFHNENFNIFLHVALRYFSSHSGPAKENFLILPVVLVNYFGSEFMR